MFWVGLDSRLIPSDEFQVDPPQNLGQQGPAAQMCTSRCLTENNGRHSAHGLHCGVGVYVRKYDEAAAKNYEGFSLTT